MDGPIKNERERLDSQLLWLERWLVFSGAVVFVGVFVEIIAKVLRAQIDDEVIGGGLVMAGVAAEVTIARIISVKADRIREIADSDITRSSAQAAIANERAAGANERAAQANERAAKAEQRTAELEVDIAHSRERQMETDQLLSRMRLEQAERATVFDVRRFAGFLESRPKGTADILYQPEDAEAEEFAERLEIGMVTGHWTISTRPQPVPPEPSSRESAMSRAGARARGITVLIGRTNNGDPARAAFFALHEAFADQVHVPRFTWDMEPSVPNGIIRIVVGPKP